jgi:hypothetical protein
MTYTTVVQKLVAETIGKNMILQLNPPLLVVTPKGKAFAHVLIDYGPDYDLLWVCFENNGECWTWRNQEIRADNNITFGRKNDND